MRQFTKERIAARLTAMRLSDELADLTDELLEMVEDLEDRIRDLEADLDYAEFGTPATAATAKGHPGQGGAA